MKTKEEIEQLAKQLCNIPIDLVIDEEERYYKNLEKYDGIIQGYTQCQEDMAHKMNNVMETLLKIRDCKDYGNNSSSLARELIQQLNKQE